MGSNALNNLPNEVKQRIKNTIDAIKETIGECKILLFGSYAKGNWLLDSDIDLIIVSDKFREQDYISRIAMLKNRMLRRGITKTHIIPLTPEEFKERKRRSVVISDALTYAIEIT